MTTDCIIIGGGLIGMLTARELALAGLSVTVVERGRAGAEASWAGGGILSPLYPWRYGDAVSALAQWSQERYQALSEALAEESGVDPQWTRSGLLMLGAAQAREAATWAARFGAEIERLDAPATTQCEPALAAVQTDALWMPRVAQVRNPRLVKALRGSIVHAGVTLKEDTPVTDLLLDHGQIRGVRTAAGTISAPRVVIAGGAWSAALVAVTGVEIAVEPVRGQMIVFDARPGLLRHVVMHEGRYLIPRRDGHVLAGSTLEYVGFDKSTTDTALAELRAVACRLVPELARFDIERQWSGLRPGSPAGVPFIGAIEAVDGLFVNAGHFRNGVVLAPASVRLLADLVLGRRPILDPAPYRPSTPRPGEGLAATAQFRTKTL